jgi:calmodulin
MYIWRGKNRRDRRDNKLQGLFSWGPDRYAKSEELDDDILRHEREEVHVDYFRHRVRVVMHEYLGTNNGKIEIQKVVAHLDELAHKEVDELEAAMEAAVTDTAILEDNEKEAAPNGDDPAQGSPNNNKESKESKKVEPKKRAIPAAIQNRNNVYEVFRKFDADGGGTLDIEEFGTLLSELEVPMTEKELEETFDLLDDDGGGEIDFEEFYEWFTSEAENQKKKNTAGYIANLVTGGMFDGFRRLVMEVEARNLAMDHAVYTAENDARQEFRIAHPPKYLCDKPMCTGMSPLWPLLSYDDYYDL